ncbi:hypothetical protein BDDG_11828 [Blastomyces dermatitidis ATCC 18188]|uniref:Protein kinase domain-containing protein n=1 Tax=Ajellomyces dermatitidis (strain ATCC 18188 / CBS 674.68) TaxID=653446 RepID=A0A0J9EKV1_AJEDA|nr:hypothetical protein BDDG_11828 [Blastomyces dermatitidis ATCC 18188]
MLMIVVSFTLTSNLITFFFQIQDYSLISELYLPNNPADLADFDTSTDPSTIRSQPLKWDYFRKGANLMKFNIALGDWGVAKVLIRAPWGPAADLWNLGAVVWKCSALYTCLVGEVHHMVITRFGSTSMKLWIYLGHFQDHFCKKVTKSLSKDTLTVRKG